MKKFIFSLIAGAVFIGVGIGVFFMEITEFTITDYLPYIMEDKIDTFTFEDPNIFTESKGETVQIHVYLGEYFKRSGKVEIVESPGTEGVEISVDYHGTKPRFQFWDNGYNEKNGETYINSYSFDCYQNHYLPKDIMEALKYMCQNKVIVENFDTYCVEKITVKTAQPELIEVNPY
ncbi:MAG: hypothetical protein IKB62_04100 [Oscillospiraceae bacterium]|nr:hypothetical protein [Oscillospiraceae bacterium]